MSNTFVMIAIFVAVGLFFYFSKKNAKQNETENNQENEESKNQ